jgi:ABC-2 type transport system ATP-binding protein
MSQPAIETKDLSVYYGSIRGVHNLDLSVQPGEVYGFLGPNGAGKTTTLRVLLDIIRPTKGQARIFGMDCQAEGVEIRRKVGYMPGELSLYSQMRADQYLSMVSSVRGNSTDKSFLHSLCERLELDTRRLIRTYSRGNKQKVGLIAALMGKPDLLILDEPTTGLDPLVQQSVLELVRETRADVRTVFFSSHILSEVQAVCDRVGIIRNGQLVATERIETLTRKQFHRLRMSFEQVPPAGVFDLPGVSEVSRLEHVITLEIREQLNAVLSKAAKYGVRDLETVPVTLEEVFLTYYGEDRRDYHA